MRLRGEDDYIAYINSIKWFRGLDHTIGLYF